MIYKLLLCSTNTYSFDWIFGKMENIKEEKTNNNNNNINTTTTNNTIILKLTSEPKEKKNVEWDASVIDNEFKNTKSSKSKKKKYF
jgi:hypothetical protein